jgi:hypothetical protein
MDSNQLRLTAKRLERYAIQSREKLWKGDYVGALADLAETGEIARRLYTATAAALKVQATESRESSTSLRDN